MFSPPHTSTNTSPIVFLLLFFNPVVPETPLNPKKNPWDVVQPNLKTTSGLVAVFEDKPLKTEHGVITVKSLVGATIK